MSNSNGIRKLGWYADTWPEAAMNIGTWMLLFWLGWTFGVPRGGYPMVYWLIGVVGAVVGIGGQLMMVLGGEQ